jgi:HD-GYP domain-containing protein (c-di-GMP phosphodiesterase class II)
MEAQDYILIATGIVTVASVIVKVTKNKYDNQVVDILLNILNVIAMNNKKRSE